MEKRIRKRILFEAKTHNDPRALALVSLLESEDSGEYRLEDREVFGDSNSYASYLHLCQEIQRHKKRLDWFISQVHQGRPLEPLVKVALWIGILQLLDHRIKPHAAINEAVELMEVAHKPFLKKVVNAILRKFQRKQAELEEALEAEPAWRRLSYPRWMAQRWEEAYGKERALAIMEAGNLLPVTEIYPNPEWGEDKLFTWLVENGYEPKRDPLRLEKPKGVFNSEPFKKGAFLVQDLSSQRLITFLGPFVKGRVLDACAAPGGKLFHLEWDYPEQIEELVALEVDEGRKHRLRTNHHRYKSKSQLRIGDAGTYQFRRPYDLILADVPCSSTGTIKKYPEIKWHRRSEDFLHNQKRQLDILRGLQRYVKPGGHLAYSTCSLETEENQGVIEAFLAEHPHYELVPLQGEPDWVTKEGFYQALPDETRMGAFAAVMKRKE